MVGGGTLVLPEPNEPLAAALIRTRPSHLSLVAAQLRQLLDHKPARAALAGCREILIGGGPCPPGWIAEARELGASPRLTYGLTEMASQVATETAGQLLPLNGTELRVDGQQEIWVRGPSRFAGYLADEKLSQPFQDGWFPTADLGRLGPSGALEIAGRRDSQFISGGENIQPESIEAAFAEHGIPIVVVGVPHPHFGMRPVAFGPDDQDHSDLARNLLPDFAQPIAWLPIGYPSGLKPRRAELAQRAIRELGRLFRDS